MASLLVCELDEIPPHSVSLRGGAADAAIPRGVDDTYPGRPAGGPVADPAPASGLILSLLIPSLSQDEGQSDAQWRRERATDRRSDAPWR
jgi:hypothetical protein